MRIRNESKRAFCFNGGSVLPGRVVDIKDEQIAKALVSGYPRELVALDEIKAEVIEVSDEKEALIAKAKELGISGNLSKWGVETLKSKIAERESILIATEE